MKKNITLASFSLILLFVFLLSSCKDSPTENESKYPPDNQYKVSITQGVWGNVWFWDGNFMPSTDNSSSGTITPVVREIYIYEATNNSMFEKTNGDTFFTKINSELIATIQSDKDGFFQISLIPGKYSFFVKEDSSFYANGWDGDGHILAATVTKNNVTKNQVDITYKAVY